MKRSFSVEEKHLDVLERISKLAGNHARIALCAIAEGKTLQEAIEIAETYPATE